MTILFWASLIIVFYTYMGYGILLRICVAIKEFIFPVGKNENVELPNVTLLIAAYNEEAVIKDKMENCLKLKYPEGKLKLMWVTDGSNDDTNERLKQYPGIELLWTPERKGKTAAINRAIPSVTTPITIFTDANTMLNEDAIVEIARRFADPKVGCVAGEKKIMVADKAASASAGEGLYWKYESYLKSLDSRLYSTVGAAGELYAIRTELFEPMPQNILLDDFILSMKIAMRGYTIKYSKESYAIETASFDMKEEEKRKVRISAGGLQSILMLMPLFNCFKYGILSFQYVSHRAMRWSIAPLLTFLLLPINIIICWQRGFASDIYLLLMILQCAFYLLACIGYILAEKKIKNKILFVPYYFLFMNISVFKGVGYLIKRNGKGTWERAKRA